MKLKSLFLLAIILAPSLSFAWRCRAEKVDVLAIGDSQTGTPNSKSYFGNFLQRCLKEKGERFVTYGRGGTRPIHWLDNADMDIVTTIQRDNLNEEKNIGWGKMVPLCKRRLAPMLRRHAPQKVLVFFGDNLLLHPEDYIASQAKKMVEVIRSHGIPFHKCFFLTPTYEMEVESQRNMPGKNIENTKAVNAIIKTAVSDKCQFIDGLELMENSPYLLESKLFKRSQPQGQTDCFGKSANDNIHFCGDAAQELANKVCEIVDSN
jgi:hypothetical protein